MSPGKHIRPIEILLVEDNEADAFLTQTAFEQGKILNHLHLATDGEMALSILNKEPPYEDHVTPDIILLDINLPKIDGREVLQAIKSHETLKRIPVIILTGSEANEDIMQMYDLHATSYITKPVGVERFNEVVKATENFWFCVVELPTQPDKK